MTETRCDEAQPFGQCILSAGHRGAHCYEWHRDPYEEILAGINRLEALMTTDAQGLTDIQTSVTALTTTVTDAVTALQALENEVASLTAAGTPVDPAQLEAISASLNNLGTQLNNALPAAQAPADPTADTAGVEGSQPS